MILIVLLTLGPQFWLFLIFAGFPVINLYTELPSELEHRDTQLMIKHLSRENLLRRRVFNRVPVLVARLLLTRLVDLVGRREHTIVDRVEELFV